MEKRQIDHGWPAHDPDPRAGTPPNVVIGVTILALLTLFSTFFWVGIIAVAVLDVGAIVGFFGTAGTWAIVDRILYPPRATEEPEA